MMIPQRILLRVPAPLIVHQITEQQRRNDNITLGTHIHLHPCDVSAPTRPNLAQCVHTDELRVGVKYTNTDARVVLSVALKIIQPCCKFGVLANFTNFHQFEMNKSNNNHS